MDKPRRKFAYHNSKSEQKFNNYFKQFQKLTITKRGFPDFMIIDENNNCLGFVEVKKTSNQKLRPEQNIFRKFCEKNGIFYFLWYPSINTENKKGRS